jgi:hypothetical protein
MLHYVRATLLNPTGPTDWIDMPLTTHMYEDYKALAEVNGGPAIVYLTQPAPGFYQARYAYATIPAPDDATDWVSTEATPLATVSETFRPGQLLIDDPYPRFSYWSSETDQLYLAQAVADPPATPADWLYTPATPANQSGKHSALVWWQDRPLALHAGSGNWQLKCTASSAEQPATLADWESLDADLESQDINRISACRLPDGLGAAYRNADPPGGVIYAWFEGNLPGGPGDWCVVEVAGGVGPDGGQAVALTPDGRPAVVYGAPDDDQLWLATMDPPA